MPIIGHVFDLEARDLFIIQIIIGVLLFWALAKLAEKVTGDRVCATLLTLGFTCIYVGKACFLDLKFGWFDGVAYFLLIMSMLYRNIILIFLFLFLACGIDERAMVASSIVYFWWKKNELARRDFSLNSLFSIGKYSSTVLVVWIAYFITRLYLSKTFGLHTPIGATAKVGLEQALSNFFGLLGAAVFTPIEFFWLIIMTAGFLVISAKQFTQLLLLVGLSLSVMLPAFLVEDVTRSLSYIFPLIFVSMLIIKQYEELLILRYLSLICCLGNFLIGTYFIFHYRIDHIVPSFKLFFVVREWML